VKARRTGTGRFYLLLPAAPMLQINCVLDCDSYFATGRSMIRRKEDFEVQVNFGQYFLADPDSYPGMGGPVPKEFPDFSSPGPLRRLQGAEGLVFIAARTHTGMVPVRYLLVDERPATSADYPQLVGELTVPFPTGRAELRGLDGRRRLRRLSARGARGHLRREARGPRDGRGGTSAFGLAGFVRLTHR